MLTSGSTPSTTKNHSTRGLLRERAYADVKRLILSGQLAKVPFLSSRKLAEVLGMSNTPIRSAVERLEAEGLLSIGPQRGIVLNELTTQEIVDHFELRQALETLVVRKLAGRLSPEQVVLLRDNIQSHQTSLNAGDIEQYIARDGEFHLLLAGFSGNADVERVLQLQRDRIYRVVLRVIEHVPGRIRESLDEHRQILEFIQAGDAVRAIAIMTHHLRSGVKAILPGCRDEDLPF